MTKTIRFAVLLSFLLLMNACGSEPQTNSAAEPTAAEVTAVRETETAGTLSTEADTAEASASEAAAETAAPSAEDTAEITAEPDPDFASVAGDWFIDGDPSLASIHIEPDGTFQTFYATGALENEGDIRYESDEIEGTVHHWYHLYSSSGEYIMGFLDDGSSIKTDLYVGNGAFPHYRRFTGEGGLADDGRGPGEEFAGIWGCGRATLEITQLSDTEFHALINWGDSAFAHMEWEYPLTYQDGRLVCSGGCTKTYVVYSSADTEPDRTVEYTDGSGEFVMQDAGIVWYDLTENRGEGMVFSNSLPD